MKITAIKVMIFIGLLSCKSNSEKKRQNIFRRKRSLFSRTNLLKVISGVKRYTMIFVLPAIFPAGKVFPVTSLLLMGLTGLQIKGLKAFMRSNTAFRDPLQLMARNTIT